MIYSITAGRTQSDQLAIFKEYLLPLNFQSCWIRGFNLVDLASSGLLINRWISFEVHLQYLRRYKCKLKFAQNAELKKI